MGIIETYVVRLADPLTLANLESLGSPIFHLGGGTVEWLPNASLHNAPILLSWRLFTGTAAVDRCTVPQPTSDVL